ncbi:MAG: hypothetical protein V7L26_26305 [Nostoc sp.]|uniref:hypothetical protein n=1 Tax=Nostoc sp. TaxID=1180 RepID=UPI002FF95E01
MIKILNSKDAINRRLYKGMIIVETAIYRVSCLNRTVLDRFLLGISYLDFAKALTPLALICLAIQVALLWWLYPEVRSLHSYLKVKPPRYTISL